VRVQERHGGSPVRTLPIVCLVIPAPRRSVTPVQDRARDTLPFARLHHTHTKRGATVTEDANRPHVLVINDTVAILELFTALLEDEGYRVTTDGFSVEMSELLRRVKAERPDVIVLDLIVQDEGKGWQFLQMLKMDRQTRAIPVVVCTAAVRMVEELQLHLDTMGVAVVLKPFDIDNVLAAIGKCLAGPGGE
jgi:CheY-like chemotaxis protein